MKDTECKDCELSNSDCGHHFEMDGVTNYDIPREGSCDKYGNCEFFKPKADTKENKDDLISRKDLKKDLASYDKEFAPDWVLNCIDKAPTVEVRDNKPKQGEWIFDGWGTYCSECGYRPKIGCGNYCSNCGADMKGGVS